jgi:uncharacterized protein (DUF488 family)
VTEPVTDGPGVTIHSVGHGAQPAAAFVVILQGAGIERVVDVRTAPGSRKHPQFGQAALTETLEQRGIEYVWRQDLGGWRKPRPDSRHVALRSPGFRGYADHMETEEFGRAVSWLIGSSSTAPTAFMCAETLWWRCHRRMIADALMARGVQVIHLMPGRAEPHRLHPVARLEVERVVYDRAEPEQPTLPG